MNETSAAARILGPAPRKLSPALEAFVGTRKAGSIRWWVLGFMVVILLGTLLPVVCTTQNALNYAQSTTPQYVMPNYPPGYQPPTTPFGSPVQPGQPISTAFDWAQGLMYKVVGGIVGTFVLVIVVIIFVTKALGSNKRKKWRFVLENGKVTNATVTANLVDYSIQVNGAPRRVVQLQVDGTHVEWGTFDHNFANLFVQGSTMEVVFTPQMPDTVLPTSMLPLQ